MKKLKFLASLVLIALTFASPQAIYGMEDFKSMVNTTGRDIRGLSAHEVSSCSDITHEIRENPFEPKKCPIEIRSNILERAAIANYFSYGNTGSIGIVCRDWYNIIKTDTMKQSINDAIYQRFLKGVLIYRPQEGSDVGRIDLPIVALADPLEGTFDLSLCGNAGQYLSISTGYRKEKKAENARKTQIWFAPRLLIEKELTTTAEHFKSIYGKWTAEVGIFWTGERDDKLGWYDYLTTKNMDNLSKISLYENWQRATPSYEVMGMDYMARMYGNNGYPCTRQPLTIQQRIIQHHPDALRVLRCFSLSFCEVRQG